MFVFGVNLGAYKSEYSIISSASSTTNCVANIVRVVHDKLGIENVSMSTIRAAGITDIQSVTNNITPNYSEAAEAVGRIVPSLNCRLICQCVRR
ncbi:glyceraldehyde-3-phosphate dehydrogenase [Suillus occidentalis]|nr:glyceraldehyde-3-phosphate dehydrogenase [Suillus occidentalis]